MRYLKPNTLRVKLFKNIKNICFNLLTIISCFNYISKYWLGDEVCYITDIFW